MTKAKKITEQELQDLQKPLDSITEMQIQLGQLEMRKHDMLHDVTMFQKELAEAQAALKEKYGKISVNIQTGEIKSDESDS